MMAYKKRYNERIRNLIMETNTGAHIRTNKLPSWHTPCTLQRKNDFQLRTNQQNADYISSKCSQVIEERDRKRRDGKHDEEKDLNKKIKQQVRIDKKRTKLETLKYLLEINEQLNGMTTFWKKFALNFTRFKDIRGERIKNC